jgi:hypothetical protein
MAAKKKDTEKENNLDPSTQLNAFLKNNPKDHYNFAESVNYKTSFGSLKLDIELGGIGPGIHRFCGLKEGGKTSEALEVTRNFLQEKNRRAVYIKAEGRLSDEMIRRSGVKFVHGDPTKEGDAWVDGTCYVHESNKFESVLEMISEMIHTNPTKKQYVFIVDSIDTLMKKSDFEKKFGESHTVAGGATLLSHFFKHMALPTSKFGHMIILMSQKRVDIPASQYSAARPEKFSGGNAALHQADLILEFLYRGTTYGEQSEYFMEGKNGQATDKNRIIGHNCKIKVEKCANEKSQMILTYPIKYGRVGGKSIWIEKELIDIMLSFGLLIKKGAWYRFDESLIEVAKESKIEIPEEQMQGLAKVEELITTNEELCSYLYKKFKEDLRKDL